MINVYDIAYSLGIALAAPIWATRKKSRDKVLTAFRERLGRMDRRAGDRPAVWIHAVSLGEVNAARALVEQLLAAHAELDVIVSTTTTTGHDRAATLYRESPRVSVVRYPLDFSAAITRALDALRPSVVVLMELETWPNFLRHCEQRNIPVVLANGRITDHSFSRYRWIRPIVATMFRRLAAVCVQDAEYARRFEALGAPRGKIHVVGTMKYDSAEVADTVAGAAELQRALRLEQNEPLWVCGSTGPGEEKLALGVYRQLLMSFSELRLAIIPRHPQRFGEVAELIQRQGFSLLRRSETLLPLPVPGERAGERVDGAVNIQKADVDDADGECGAGSLEALKRSARDEEDSLPNPLPEYREREDAPAPTNELAPEAAHRSENALAASGALSPPIAPAPLGVFAPPSSPAMRREPDSSLLGTPPPVFLGDTMGELRKFYALASVVFVGRSLIDLGSRQHGSDMIEPAALGKACVVGPFTGNFDQAVRALKSADAIVEVGDAAALEAAVLKLLLDAPAAQALGKRAQRVVAEQRGSTARHLELIGSFLP